MERLGNSSSHSKNTLLALIGLSLIFHILFLSTNSEQKKDIPMKDLNGLKVVDFSNVQLKKASQEIALKDLKTTTATLTKKKTTRVKEFKEKINSPLEKINIANPQVNDFLKENNLLSASSDRINNTDANFQIEMPPGLKLDELNEAQMVLYNFQMRTAKQYFNSFYANLNEHKQQKPHLNFPMTEDKQRMTGKITYDESGNIVKIQMMRVTSKAQLQDFFESLLKRMHTVSNPPKMILNNGEFSVYFSLNIY